MKKDDTEALENGIERKIGNLQEVQDQSQRAAAAEDEDSTVVGLSDARKRRSQDSPATSTLLNICTEDSIALAFAERHRGQYAYLHGIGAWHKWCGTHWRLDVTGKLFEDIRTLARDYNKENKVSMGRHSFTKGVEGHLRSDPIYARDARDFDADSFLLNCPDGTWNLRSGRRRNHDPEDRISMITAASPSMNGGERFLQFLEEIALGDQDLIDFLQRALGSCLSGAIAEHWLMFWIGTGRNGKNTLGDLVAKIMGDYATNIPSSALMAQRNQQHPTELMELKGKRLVTSSEVEEGAHWAESRIKELTGDEFLKGRYMRQDFIKFQRVHKHLIYGNHRPALRNVDQAIKSRFRIVPFKASFANNPDPRLPEKLMAESAFVLHWLMEGHGMWMDNGCRVGTCDAVEAESQDYFDSQATVDMWVEERCNLVPDEGQSGRTWSKSSELYADYAEWKGRRGESPQGQQRFAESMQRRFRKIKVDGIRYVGICLKYSNPEIGHE